MTDAYISVEGIASAIRRRPAATPRSSRTSGSAIERGEFVCLIGHSGCGKTTILNILAGLDAPTDGVVIVDGQEIDGPSLDRAVIFQGHALMPWMTVHGQRRLRASRRAGRWTEAQVHDAARQNSSSWSA